MSRYPKIGGVAEELTHRTCGIHCAAENGNFLQKTNNRFVHATPQTGAQRRSWDQRCTSDHTMHTKEPNLPTTNRSINYMPSQKKNSALPTRITIIPEHRMQVSQPDCDKRVGQHPRTCVSKSMIRSTVMRG